MTTKRATLRKGKSNKPKTVTKGNKSRAQRKEATAKRIALAAVVAAVAKKADGNVKPKQKAEPTSAPAKSSAKKIPAAPKKK